MSMPENIHNFPHIIKGSPKPSKKTTPLENYSNLSFIHFFKVLGLVYIIQNSSTLGLWIFSGSNCIFNLGMLMATDWYFLCSVN